MIRDLSDMADTPALPTFNDFAEVTYYYQKEAHKTSISRLFWILLCVSGRRPCSFGPTNMNNNIRQSDTYHVLIA